MDLRSDGCIRAASVKDTSAEPTGFVFDTSGTMDHVSIPPTDDGGMTPVDGHGTDDLVRIPGFARRATH